MKWLARWSVAVMLGVAAAGCSGGESPDVAAVRKTWADIYQANRQDDGERAASLLTASSIAAYATPIEAALHGKRADVEALDDWDLMEVLRIRVRAKASEIQSLSPREYVVFATSKGFYHPDYEATELGRVNITGDTATATEVADGEKSPYLLRFRKEDGVWKIDEESYRAPFNQQVADEAGSDRRERAQYLLELVGEETGLEASESVWRPMINPVGAFNPGGG